MDKFERDWDGLQLMVGFEKTCQLNSFAKVSFVVYSV